MEKKMGASQLTESVDESGSEFNCYNEKEDGDVKGLIERINNIDLGDERKKPNESFEVEDKVHLMEDH